MQQRFVSNRVGDVDGSSFQGLYFIDEHFKNSHRPTVLLFSYWFITIIIALRFFFISCVCVVVELTDYRHCCYYRCEGEDKSVDKQKKNQEDEI